MNTKLLRAGIAGLILTAALSATAGPATAGPDSATPQSSAVADTGSSDTLWEIWGRIADATLYPLFYGLSTLSGEHCGGGDCNGGGPSGSS